MYSLVVENIKCIIAAGGLGTRLQEFRGNKSTKILLEVNGTPMINRQISQLVKWGMRKFVIITNPEYSNMIEEVTGASLENVVKWHPETDYLGNHRLSNKKFIDFMEFSNPRTLKQGILQSWKSIKDANKSYNPLKYLDQAKDKDIDLKQFFPK